VKFTLSLLFTTLCSPAFGAAYSITQVLQNTVGDTAVVTGSGGKDNTTTWTAGVVGRYLISDGFNTYGLAVSVTNPTGTLSAGTDTLMVARTVNSQGLTDTGTLSIYFNPNTTGTWSADINFSFYNVDGGGAFTTAYSPTLLLTSLDIDANQRYYTDNADFSGNLVYTPTNLTTPAAGVTGYTGFTATGNASFSDPASAVSSTGAAGVTEFDVRVSHDSVALFMFEFRDPSQVLVPEPSTALLGGLGALALFRRRRNA
jgi:hypothetical protein